jgi:hypothetical protein
VDSDHVAGPVEWFCEDGYEISDSIRCWENIEWLSDWQLHGGLCVHFIRVVACSAEFCSLRLANAL